jgi:hypothetical protein
MKRVTVIIDDNGYATCQLWTTKGCRPGTKRCAKFWISAPREHSPSILARHFGAWVNRRKGNLGVSMLYSDEGVAYGYQAVRGAR